jgi:hypothetical protein
MRTTKRTTRANEQLMVQRSEPKLTLKQETFVNALLETGNQYQAYCRAYELREHEPRGHRCRSF